MRKRAMSPTETVLESPFKIDTIARTSAPNGTAGAWHRYVISQGPNTIAGIRTGTEAEVTMQLQEMVERLNDRRAGRTRPRSKA